MQIEFPRASQFTSLTEVRQKDLMKTFEDLHPIEGVTKLAEPAEALSSGWIEVIKLYLLILQ